MPIPKEINKKSLVHHIPVGGFVAPPGNKEILEKLDQIIKELFVIKNRQTPKDGFRFENGIWRKE